MKKIDSWAIKNLNGSPLVSLDEISGWQQQIRSCLDCLYLVWVWWTVLTWLIFFLKKF